MVAATSHITQAFDQVCQEAKEAEGCYVVLMCRVPFFGGPEEGGWWGADDIVVKYQRFDLQEAAEIAKERIEAMAKEMNAEAKRASDGQCLRECEWLDARGLDADYLPEPDGPEEYHVIVSDTIPQSSYGCRHYE